MTTLLRTLVSLGLFASFLLSCLSLPSRIVESERIQRERAEQEMEIRATEAHLRELWRKTPHEHEWVPVPPSAWQQECRKCGIRMPWNVQIRY